MMFSRWDPNSGEYDYFQAAGELAALNDDLPIPKMPPPVSGLGKQIGNPSTECGRPLPAGATHVGTGEFAEGHVTPPVGVKLSGTNGAPSWRMDVVSFGIGVAAVAGIWFFFGRK